MLSGYLSFLRCSGALDFALKTLVNRNSCIQFVVWNGDVTTWNVEMSDIVKQYIKHSRQCFIGISKHTENRELKYEQRIIADETRVDVFE